MHSPAHSVGKRQICIVTTTHATSSLHHCFTECLLCAGPVLSMKEREAYFLSSGRSEPKWNEREPLIGNQRRVFGKALKECTTPPMAMLSVWEPGPGVTRRGLIMGCNHWLLRDSLLTPELAAAAGHAGRLGSQPSLPFSSWFPMRIPSLQRLIWRQDTTLFKEIEGLHHLSPCPGVAP